MKTLRIITAGLVAAGCTFCTAAIAGDVRTPIYPAGNKPIAPYSPGVKLNNGMLFVSGQIAYVKGAIPDHAKDGKDDVADQTRIVMENIRTVLNEAGYSFDDAVRATVFMTDIKNYGAINKVYGTYWGEGKIPPARAAVEVSALPGGKPGAACTRRNITDRSQVGLQHFPRAPVSAKLGTGDALVAGGSSFAMQQSFLLDPGSSKGDDDRASHQDDATSATPPNPR